MIIHGNKRTQCRCSNNACRHRHTLAKHPDKYARPQRCPVCRKGYYRPATYRSEGRERKHRGVCCCDGYHFPHRPGSLLCHTGRLGGVAFHEAGLLGGDALDLLHRPKAAQAEHAQQDGPHF